MSRARTFPARLAAAAPFLVLVLAGQSPAPDDAEVVTRVLEEHNKARAEAKLSPLRLDVKLTAAARAHAADMAAHATMTHTGTDQSMPAERIDRQAYHGRRTGENVAAGQETPAAVMRSWMESPPHKENILGEFRDAGIAVAKADDGTRYWCVDFGDPWPKVDPAKAAEAVVEGLNRERVKAGLKPLTVQAPLSAAANRLIARLARADTLDTEMVEGASPRQAMEESGYRFRSVGFLAASGLPGPSELVSHLLEGEDNRKACLGDYSDAGVGYAPSARDVPYWFVIVARPLGR